MFWLRSGQSNFSTWSICLASLQHVIWLKSFWLEGKLVSETIWSKLFHLHFSFGSNKGRHHHHLKHLIEDVRYFLCLVDEKISLKWFSEDVEYFLWLVGIYHIPYLRFLSFAWWWSVVLKCERRRQLLSAKKSIISAPYCSNSSIVPWVVNLETSKKHSGNQRETLCFSSLYFVCYSTTKLT